MLEGVLNQYTNFNTWTLKRSDLIISPAGVNNISKQHFRTLITDVMSDHT